MDYQMRKKFTSAKSHCSQVFSSLQLEAALLDVTVFFLGG
jgi:hypothetical protein